MRSTSVVGSTIALLVVGFLALLFIVGMTLWLGDRAQVYFDATIEARDTRSAAVEARYALQTAESSQRGYLTTGNQIYLAPYSTARVLALRRLDMVTERLATSPEKRPVLDRLREIVEEKFAEMDQTIALKRGRQDNEALAIFRTNRGKALMDEANVFLAGIIRTADEQLTDGVSEQRENAALLRTVTIIGGILIVLVVGIVIFTVLRYTRELRAARDEVGALNANLERRVEERTADLAEANEEIQRFAYIVTHDLRAPLVNIMGFTSELESGIASLQALIDKSKAESNPDDPIVKQARIAATADLPEAIGFIRSSTKKMDGLIGAILKLSREGKRPLRPERIEIAALVETSAAAIRHQLSEAKGEIDTELGVTSIVADKLSVEQILGNLLDNAVKYRSPTRPLRIDVRSRPDAGRATAIEVIDNGRGIAETDLERIFEPFRRSGTQDQPGDGIGLAYVRTLVRNLGGDVTVASELGKGTTFQIILPTDVPQSESNAP